MLTRKEFLWQSTAFVAGMTAARSLIPNSILAQSSTDPLVEKALRDGQTEIIFAGGSGVYLDVVKRLFYEPFTKATGIRITPVSVSYGERAAKLKAMASVKNVEWDVVSLPIDSLIPSVRIYLRNLSDCSALPNVAKFGIPGTCLGWGVIWDIGGAPLVFDTQAFPSGRPQPQSWSDFWDVTKFPGPRALPNVGIPWWPLMAALQADGVPKDKLFPLDLDRAFRKMDQIKPHVAVWWTSGDQSQQIVRRKEVVMSMMFSGRAFQLRSQSLPVEIIWNGAPLDTAFWAVTKDARRPEAALAFLNFVMTRPEAHAEYARVQFADTANKLALSRLSPDEQKSRAVYPDNWRKLVPVDRAWVSDNHNRVLERWLKWLGR